MTNTACGASPKVKSHHLEREAVLYVRQSSLHQVLNNTESGRRQYDLRRTAVALGWQEDRIRVIDEDQGQSGEGQHGRSGYQRMLASVAAGEVGLILSLENSRLGRNNADMQRLYQVAAIMETLILDEAGIHDPKDKSDRLMLSMMSSMSEYELGGIKSRLVGGQVSKAQRGELKLALPVGLVYDASDNVVLDPDRAVVEAVERLFETFRKKGSAMQVTKWYRKNGIALPSRPLKGGRPLRWSVPNHGQVRRFLKNPRYAGCYAYGRTRSKLRLDGSHQFRAVPRSEWMVCLPRAHVGYISWDEYCRNQETLARNARSFAPGKFRGSAPRHGAGLLQSIALCGKCGQGITTHYLKQPNGNREAARYYKCQHAVVRHGGRTCQSMRAEPVDAAVSEFVVAAVNRDSLELALSVEQQMRDDFLQADRQRANRIEALEHAADLARRRYCEVDPANRLVAASLERDWNERLREVQRARQERREFAQASQARIPEEQAAKIRELASDFGKVWHAPSTGHAERKRLLRHLVEDATLTRDEYSVRVDLRLRGGKAVTLDPVELARPACQLRQTPEESVRALTALVARMCDADAADELNRQGHRTWDGAVFTAKRVRAVRSSRGLPCYLERWRSKLRSEGWETAAELAARTGVRLKTLQARARHGLDFESAAMRSGKKRFTMYRVIRGTRSARHGGEPAPGTTGLDRMPPARHPPPTTAPEAVLELQELVRHMADAEAARELNRSGHRAWDGTAFTARRVQSIRAHRGWPSHLQRWRRQLRSQGWLQGRELASAVGIKRATLEARAKRGCGFEQKTLRQGGRTYRMFRVSKVNQEGGQP